MQRLDQNVPDQRLDEVGGKDGARLLQDRHQGEVPLLQSRAEKRVRAGGALPGLCVEAAQLGGGEPLDEEVLQTLSED